MGDNHRDDVPEDPQPDQQPNVPPAAQDASSVTKIG